MDSKCVLLLLYIGVVHYAQAQSLVCTDPNQEYTDNYTPNCEVSCDRPHLMPCMYISNKSGCRCKNGYYRTRQGQCVRLEECYRNPYPYPYPAPYPSPAPSPAPYPTPYPIVSPYVDPSFYPIVSPYVDPSSYPYPSPYSSPGTLNPQPLLLGSKRQSQSPLSLLARRPGLPGSAR